MAYPRRVGKVAAKKAYTGARKSVSAEIILTAVKAYPWSEQSKFIPYPATWLNDERWQDELPVPEPKRLPGRSYAGCL